MISLSDNTGTNFILDRVGGGNAVNEKVVQFEQRSSEELLGILKKKQDRSCIGLDMKDVTVAGKSSALDHLRSDVAIVYSNRE
jgi:beta-lactamase class A